MQGGRDAPDAVRVTLATAGRRICANAEYALHAPESIRRLFSDDPYAVHRTIEVAESWRDVNTTAT